MSHEGLMSPICEAMVETRFLLHFHFLVENAAIRGLTLHLFPAIFLLVCGDLLAWN